jgi:hypothetical protein
LQILPHRLEDHRIALDTQDVDGQIQRASNGSNERLRPIVLQGLRQELAQLALLKSLQVFQPVVNVQLFLKNRQAIIPPPQLKQTTGSQA